MLDWTESNQDWCHQLRFHMDRRTGPWPDRFLSRRGQLTNTLAINELNNATQDNEACTVQGGIK